MTDETPDVVSRARAALDGITPGEWWVFKQSERHDDDPEWVIESNGGPSSDNPIGVVGHGVEQGEVDATFIAAAPDLVRDLLAEVDRLRQQPVELSASMLADAVKAEAERDKARAAVMRVIAACVDADLESVAFMGEPGVVMTTVIRRALDGEA
ncbi:hypothetical protein [Gordonia sp. (in: high G+C Gram-positive bacteria)]|uniref:hypothetical protein n=1 Tax=Gordonia sp. (in: high G+C Gram-positive bacteria) TaxID=84139 RepID=UPI0033420AD9